MDWISFVLGVIFGVVVFGRAAYKIGQKAAERVIGRSMW